MKAVRREIEGSDVAAAPVVSEGGRSPSMLSTGLQGMTPNPSTIGPLAPGQRWSVGRKREVVLRLLRGESVELLSRELGVPIYKLEQWREKADAALDGALKERESDPASGELAAAMPRIGELSMEVELLRARIGRPDPEVAVMAEATPPTTGRRYGVARVCQIWDQPRSSFYPACATRPPQAGAVAPASPSARRGPKPSVGDEALLAAIHADLERSPWTGEGHRKVWARLRAIDGVRVSSKRCCGSCASMACCRPIALARAPTRRTIGGSSPRRRM